MDPKQTIIDAADASDRKDWETCRERLAAYREWRNKGGFEPVIQPPVPGITKGWNGDFAEKELLDKLKSYGELPADFPHEWFERMGRTGEEDADENEDGHWRRQARLPD